MMLAARPDTRRRSDEIQFRLIYAATFPAFLLAASLARLAPWRAASRPSRSAPALSIVGQARASARTCGSFALMG